MVCLSKPNEELGCLCRPGCSGEAETGRGGEQPGWPAWCATYRVNSRACKQHSRPASFYILIATCTTSLAWQSNTKASCAGKRPRMSLAEEDAGRGDAGDEGPSTSGRDSNGATASGGVLPHRQYRGQRVETPSYPGAFCCLHCLYPATAFSSSLCCTMFALHAAINKHLCVPKLVR